MTRGRIKKTYIDDLIEDTGLKDIKETETMIMNREQWIMLISTADRQKKTTQVK